MIVKEINEAQKLKLKEIFEEMDADGGRILSAGIIFENNLSPKFQKFHRKRADQDYEPNYIFITF